MKIIRILGGLGNQMFQYSLYINLKNKLTEEIKLDLSEFKKYKLHNNFELDRIFNLPIQHSNFFENFYYGGNNTDFLSLLFKKIFGTRASYYCQPNSSVFEKQILEKEIIYLDGYWQSEDFFSDCEGEIRKLFAFPEIVDEKNIFILKKICSTLSISIHVRRGDYLGHAELDNCCDEQYYKSAIKYVKEKYNTAVFFVFSNDIEWCRKNITEKGAYFIDWNNGQLSYLDMHLMSKCKHNIIANSSFSWWGAWLNNNSLKEVVAPKYWFQPFNKENLLISEKLIPKKWKRI